MTDLEFQLLRKHIAEYCGILIPEDKAYFIESRLSRLMVEEKLDSFSALYQRICYATNNAINERVIDAITTNETLWFRDKHPWLILERVYLPRFIEQLRSGERNRIRIWSAAASTGQEAYSTAMAIDNYLATRFIKDVSLSQFEIFATDISRSVLTLARNARYDAVSIIRGLDDSIKKRYFTNEGVVWQLCDKIKNAVTFQHFNLNDSFIKLGQFDIIFCRYVMIYFSEQTRALLYPKLADALNDDGAMFIGAYEYFADLGNLFDKQQLENGVYYIKTRGTQNRR